MNQYYSVIERMCFDLQDDLTPETMTKLLSAFIEGISICMALAPSMESQDAVLDSILAKIRDRSAQLFDSFHDSQESPEAQEPCADPDCPVHGLNASLATMTPGGNA